MTAVVLRHAFPTENLPGREPAISTRILRALDDLQKSPLALPHAMSNSLILAYRRTGPDPEATWLESWEAWVCAMQSASAIFEAATTAEDSVDCLIHHEIRTVPAFDKPQSFVDAGKWITAFWLAVVCRNPERITALCRVPVAKLRESGAVYDDGVYPWIETLQAYWLGRPEFAQKLVEAAQGTAPEAAPIAGQEFTSLITWPPMDLLRHLATGEHEKFNRSLVEALDAHKLYWTADDERAEDCDGWVALAPLALAVLAQDAGFPVEVESGYLPKHLLKGTWVGEFPT
ncbi:immunity 49 family protein [Streptomyces sp. NPDC000594]|uniref:immunity 49 family protein n=1 Tax=Streptomyces sp. NPDC000594 TaxID=3154261 RepID=UPI003319309A